MKAMLLAAGLGQRMRPLTLLRAKPVLPVLGRPLLAHTLERLARAGVREAIVNLHHLPESVTAALGTGRRFGMRLSYVREPVILGTGGGPRAVRDFFEGGPALLVNGDVWFDYDLRRVVSRHRVSGASATLALRAMAKNDSYSAIVTDRAGRIVSIAGHPRSGRGTVSMFTGIHVLDSRLLERLPHGPSDSVRDLYVPMLAEGARLAGVRPAGAWYDFGRPALYRDAQLRMLPRRGRSQLVVGAAARVSTGAEVSRSVIGARSRVGAGSRVDRSVLWEGAVVEPRAQVLRAIVTAGAVVRKGERADGVIVLPLATEGLDERAGFERHGDMAWVGIE
ncbi:MAG TPA: NDP-sugar synthase [Vicinamibacteria bacterium]|jgi:NDP-sugar pyrophosphorylase family protein